MKTPAQPQFTTLFDVDKVTRDDIAYWMAYWRPAGSGPLSAMKVICGLLEQLAALKGFEPISMDEAREVMRRRLTQ